MNFSSPFINNYMHETSGVDPETKGHFKDVSGLNFLALQTVHYG